MPVSERPTKNTTREEASTDIFIQVLKHRIIDTWLFTFRKVCTFLKLNLSGKSVLYPTEFVLAMS